MRTRLIIAGLLVLWLAAESRFSPAYFVATVQSSLADLDDAIAPACVRAQSVRSAALQAAPLGPQHYDPDLEPFRTVAIAP
jgi:hypothetical protein